LRFLVQRSTAARVTVDGKTTGEIAKGLVILVGVTHNDEQADIDYLVNKTVNLRIFRGDGGQAWFDQSLLDVGGGVLLVSQFTLYADTRKGRRPGFTESAPSEVAAPIFERVAEAFRDTGVDVQLGVFGAMMDVELVNEGPATFILDSADRHRSRRRG
jgi:D-tyrosyl-tRNA(Tyr) deacylase